MKLSVAVFGRMPSEPVPEDMMESLLARFGDWNG